MSSVLAPEEARRRQEAFVRKVNERAAGVQAVVPMMRLLPEVEPIAEDAAPLLTKRERQVAQLLLAGFSNVEIAAQLWVSEETAKTHMRRVIHKTGARNRVHAAVLIARGDVAHLVDCQEDAVAVAS